MTVRTAEQNWARNVTYSASALAAPRSVEELQRLVADSDQVRALGSRHSFTTIADTTGTLVSLGRMPDAIEIDPSTRTVRVGAGTSYGVLGRHLESRGYALANLASLPHISVGGAIATATHGSGRLNQNLSAAVAAMQIVQADGSIREVVRGDRDFDAYAVGLGALGIVTEVTLDIEPTFDMAVTVFENLPWHVLHESLDDITGAAYNVGLFTDWVGDAVAQVWVKRRVGAADPVSAAVAEAFFGAPPATRQLHPLPGISAEVTTDQLGVPGAWIDRLPHFKLEFTPSNGDEIQSEWLVPLESASAVVETLRGLGDRIAPALQISELRTVASDPFWMSTAYQRDSLAVHFTWKPDPRQVEDLLPVLEAALEPFGARPHWGKVFAADAARLRPLYDRMPDFIALADRVDPDQKFRNAFLRRTVFDG